MYQVIQQTHEEKVKMYMKLPKKQIIEMLIECNRIISIITPIVTTINKTKGTSDTTIG